MDEFGKIPQSCPVQPERYTLRVSDDELERFKTLLSLSPIAPSTYENALPKFGATRDWLIEAKDTWLNKFDWRAHEARINSFPNFKLNVPGTVQGEIKLHFVALFSRKPDAIPIMLMHGWPGSFLEFLPLLKLLADKYTPETLPYHAIVPSLPGYALSEGPPLDKNFDIDDLTRIMNQLMVELGFGEKGYVAQGGDVGSMVARKLATVPECKAIHVNVIVPTRESFQTTAEELTEQEKVSWDRGMEFYKTGLAYALTHNTRPATIGLALSASPLALLAWIGEKMRDWVDPRHPLDLDTILAKISLYWFTQSLPRCVYPYRALANMHYVIPEKPFGYSYFPYDLFLLPAADCKKHFPDMIRYVHDKGGHFAALEQPELLLADVEDFVGRFKNVFE